MSNTVYDLIDSLEKYLKGESNKTQKRVNSHAKKIRTGLKKGEFDYFLMHLHHPVFSKNEGRRYLLIPSESLLNNIIGFLSKLLPKKEVKKIDLATASFFYDIVHKVYFSILGRADSFSEALYRRFSGNDNRYIYFYFDFIDGDESHSLISFSKEENREDDEEIYRIEVSLKLKEELLGGNSENGISFLSTIFYKHIWDNYKILRTLQFEKKEFEKKILASKSTLEQECFFRIKEAYISNLVAKSLHNKCLLKNLNQIWDLFFGGDLEITTIGNGNGQNNVSFNFNKFEKVFSLFQALAIYSEIK